MHLTDIGFTEWFDQKRQALQRPELSAARITRVDRDRYLVRNEHDEIQAEPTGKLLYAAESSQDLPCVGDWAMVQYYNDGTLAIIHEILPRRTFLRRKSPGKGVEYQMIASNIDAAFIVQACDRDFNLQRMERYLVMVADGRIEPVIVLSKSDLVDGKTLAELIAAIRRAGITARVMSLSNVTGAGMEEFRAALEPSKTYCLLGSSGVGKTTLLNHLLGREEFETQAVREKDSRGRHTTSRRQLTILDSGALLIDTPGLREIGLISAAEGISDSFADIVELAAECRFSDCTHTVEAGCAILEAVRTGALAEERHRAYQKLVKESAFHEMSYVERRKKDKQFGKMVKTALSEVRKRKPHQ